MPSISFLKLLDELLAELGLSLLSENPLPAQISLLPSPLVSHSEGSSPEAKDKESADRSSSSKEAEKQRHGKSD